MNIYLIGYMGSGKTTVGKRLARLMNYEFVDLDHLFEERYHISVFDFFEKYDEEAFRKIENELIKEISEKEDLVISTGGGAPCFYNNMELMNKSGITVYLQMAIKSLVDRLSNAKKARPILKGLSEDELYDFIESQMAKREAFYNQAQVKVKGESIQTDGLYEAIKPLLTNQ